MKFQNITFPISNEIEHFLNQNSAASDKRDFIIVSLLIYNLRTNREWSIGLSCHEGLSPEESISLKVDLDPDNSFSASYESFINYVNDVLNQKALSINPTEESAVDAFKGNAFNIVIKKVKQLTDPVIDYSDAITIVISEDLECKFIYNQNSWKTSEVEAIIHHIDTLQNSILKNPESPIKLLRLLTDEEWQKVIYEWNDYVSPYPSDKTIHQLFEEHVAASPEAIAVVFDEKKLTYRELNEKSNQLARYLQKQGVGSDSVIAICIERSLEMVIGLMGILKAGASYVPLDLNYPLERLEYMLEITESPFVITMEKWRKSLPPNSKNALFLDTDKASIEEQDVENLPFSGTSESLSCVLFTSGSTGKPKGVCLPHKGVVRLVQNTNYVTLNHETIMMGVTTLAFDPSLLEVWGSLTNGGQLVLVPSMHPSMVELKEIVKKYQINTIFLSTALMHLFIEQDLSDLTSIRHLMTGGDVYSLTHAKKAKEQLPNAMVMNGYGPTENTTYSSFFEIKPDNLIYPTVPIGIPISNSQMYILDKWLQPLPVGVPGELYTAGDGLAKGYMKRPDLTAERFIPNPFHPELSPFMYKTGDQSKYLSDGNVEFMGRFDNQVKVRGIRIELGEIEAAMNLFPNVSESVVIAHGSNANDKQLYGYVVAIPGTAFCLDGLREYLGKKLPKFMVPTFLKQLDAFPLTPNGKIDKKNLPLPSSSSATEEKNQEENNILYEDPLT
jgi:amino acid adenylation domain-containing protein